MHFRNLTENIHIFLIASWNRSFAINMQKREDFIFETKHNHLLPWSRSISFIARRADLIWQQVSPMSNIFLHKSHPSHTFPWAVTQTHPRPFLFTPGPSHRGTAHHTTQGHLTAVCWCGATSYSLCLVCFDVSVSGWRMLDGWVGWRGQAGGAWFHGPLLTTRNWHHRGAFPECQASLRWPLQFFSECYTAASRLLFKTVNSREMYAIPRWGKRFIKNLESG